MAYNPKRSGMGNLDAPEADAYAEKMKDKESEEDIDRDIAGVRSKYSIASTKSYPELKEGYQRRYAELEERKNRVNAIPDRYKENR